MSEETSQKRVAIIGGGFGGTGAAYYLRQLAGGKKDNFNVTIFEKNMYLGGRTNVTDIGGVMTEIGGSVLIPSFKHAQKLIREFDFQTESPYVTKKMITGLWNGDKFIYKANTTSFLQEIFLAVETILRYGTAPISVMKLAKEIESQWEGLYDIQISKKETWNNPAELFSQLGIDKYAETTTFDYLVKKAKVDKAYVNELVTGVLRALNGQSPKTANAFAGIVSQMGAIVTTSAVKGGNNRLCEQMVAASQAKVHLGSVVTKVAGVKGGGYELSYRKTLPMDEYGRYDPHAPEGIVTEHFDALILAAPFNTLDIEWERVTFPENITRPVDQQTVYEAFIVGKLNPDFFGVKPDEMVDMVVTTDNDKIPFAAIMYVKKFGKGRRLYKVFSLTPLAPELIHRLFSPSYGDAKYITWKPAFPVASPAKEYPDTFVSKSLVYLNAIEQLSSNIEVSLISAYNGAQLLLNAGDITAPAGTGGRAAGSSRGKGKGSRKGKEKVGGKGDEKARDETKGVKEKNGGKAKGGNKKRATPAKKTGKGGGKK